jgi:hypothetical protein
MERRISDRKYKNMRMNQFQKNIEKQIMFTDNKDDLTMLASLYVTTGKNIIVNLFGEEAAKDMFGKLKFDKKD